MHGTCQCAVQAMQALPFVSLHAWIVPLTVVPCELLATWSLHMQGLLGGKEGAVLRWVQPGSNLGSTPWKILYERQGHFVQVGLAFHALSCVVDAPRKLDSAADGCPV